MGDSTAEYEELNNVGQDCTGSAQALYRQSLFPLLLVRRISNLNVLLRKPINQVLQLINQVAWKINQMDCMINQMDCMINQVT
ncbi:MAG: hypothetical protein LBE37_07645 [Sphingobacterium sp.]|nr:hypothetical protein [Sphingobacterium sp.]